MDPADASNSSGHRIAYTRPRSLAWRYLTQLPQGLTAARVSELFRVRGGPLHSLGPPSIPRRRHGSPRSTLRGMDAEPFHQAHRVVRRAHFHVVVAVDVDVLSGL